MNRGGALLAGVLASAAAAAALMATLGHATTPGSNGQIAYSRYRYVNNPLRREIWVARPDGNTQRRLTHVPADYVDSNPSWAPDGSRLVFTRCPAGEGRCTIWSIKSDGRRQHMLSRRCGETVSAACPEDNSAAYSPDGRRLAFIRFVKSAGIAISDAGLRHVRVLFPFGQGPGSPDIGPVAWSPDGNELALAVHNGNGKRFQPVDGNAIFVVNVDGSGLHRVTPWSLRAGGDGLDWSPDGTHILFRTVVVVRDDPGPSTGNLYTIKPDGSDVRQITHLQPGTGVQLGSYSPDGKSIVFATTAGATSWPTGAGAWPDVFVIKADGTGVTPVTRTKNWEGTPEWGPRP